MARQFTSIIIIASLFSLTACAQPMEGRLKNGKTVQFSYGTPIWDSGEISATLPDGEFFKGKYVNKNGSMFGAGVGWSGNGGMFGGKAYSGDMVATLIGDKGHSMECTFTPNHTSINVWKSGVGKCEVSDGRKIDVVF